MHFCLWDTSVETRTEHQMRDAITELVETLKTQKAAAEHLGISGVYLGDILHGRRGISDRVAERIGWKRVVVFVRAAK